MSVIKEFKEFAMKGNVMDMAVGIIIGAAFGKVISSFVADIIMPPLGVLVGKNDFSSYHVVLAPEQVNVAGEIIKEAVTLNRGIFVQSIVDFLVVAIAIFFAIKVVNKLKKKQAQAEKKAWPTKDQELLMEIRDLLKK